MLLLIEMCCLYGNIFGNVPLSIVKKRFEAVMISFKIFMNFAQNHFTQPELFTSLNIILSVGLATFMRINI